MAAKRPFFQSAEIYKLGERVLISPYARTRDGVRRGMATLATAQIDDPSDIGAKVLAMLELCEDDVADDYTGGKAPSTDVILRETKLRSWSAFQKKSLSVSLFREINAPEIELTPNRHVSRWSEGIIEKTRTCSTEPQEIGLAVLAGLSDAE